jgi:Hypothetical protein (DUF2513)
MQRDMELIRKIMLAVEEHEHAFMEGEPHIEGYSNEQISYHSYLIGDAGLAAVTDITYRGARSPMGQISHLTWQGHEFLDAARDDTVWNKTRERLGATGKTLLTVPLSVLMAVLIDEIKRHLGLP